jgi:hypothetical protein
VSIEPASFDTLWTILPGHWIIRVAEANQRALTFWDDVVRQFTRGQFDQSTRDDNGRRWRVFAVDAGGAQ